MEYKYVLEKKLAIWTDYGSVKGTKRLKCNKKNNKTNMFWSV